MTYQRSRAIGKQILEQSYYCKGASDCLDLMERIIATALFDERRRVLDEAANLYESIKPSCDHEPGCGAGAMGAVLQFRDLIRAKAHAGQEG